MNDRDPSGPNSPRDAEKANRMSEQPAMSLGWVLGVVFSVLIVAWTLRVAPEDSYMIVHDSLDSIVPTYHVLTHDPSFLGSSNEPFTPFLGGIPRGYVPSETSLLILPYRCLPTAWAYVSWVAVMRLVGFWGMWLLLRRAALLGDSPMTALGVAMLFACLPFWPHHGLAIAGQPMLLHAWLCIRDREFVPPSLGFFAIFGFSSSVVTMGVFVLPCLALAAAVDAWRRRAIPWLPIIAIGLLAASYVSSHYRLVGVSLSGLDSHRAEFNSQYTHSLKGALRLAYDNLIQGQYHAMSVQKPVILLAVVLALATGVGRLARNRMRAFFSRNGVGPRDEMSSRSVKLLVGLCVLAVAASLFFGLARWQAAEAVACKIPLSRVLNPQRVDYFHPFLWCLAFAVALGVIRSNWKWGSFFVAVLLACQALAVFGAYDGRRLVHTPFQCGIGRYQYDVTMREFFSEDLFADIGDHVGRQRDEYRVASLGMHPTIALYNGFQTVDGYWMSYPLEYKHRFREAIAPELEKDKSLRAYFDNWGSRCCLVSSELGRSFMYTKTDARRSIESLSLDTEALWRLDCRYIFSAVEIANHQEMRLKCEGVFRRDDSPWEVHVYALSPPSGDEGPSRENADAVTTDIAVPESPEGHSAGSSEIGAR